MAAIDLIHGGKIRNIFEKHSGFDRMVKVSAGDGKHSRKVLESAVGLRADVAGHQLSRGRIKTNLSSAENKSACFDGLGIRAYRLGRILGFNYVARSCAASRRGLWTRVLRPKKKTNRAEQQHCTNHLDFHTYAPGEDYSSE